MHGSVSPIFIDAEIPTGPNFNLHDLRTKAQNFQPDPDYIYFGHFRNRTSVDIFDAGARKIYWADESGNYDSNNTTELRSNIVGNGGGLGYSSFTGSFQPYIAHLTSDSLDDVVVGFGIFNIPFSNDSFYLALFKGSTLYQKRYAYEDTSCVIPGPYDDYSYFRPTTKGDFRGTGRDDLIIADIYPNAFYFRNDPPFSLEKLRHAMFYDTLWTKPSRWKDTNSNNQKVLWIFTGQSLSMHAIPKTGGDNSYDWVVWIPTKDSGDLISIFRGDPDFGSHRITIDSATFIIHRPGFESHWPVFFSNAGDMTGTGNEVLYVDGDNNVDLAYQNFYVTGKALDDHIDIYNSFTAGALLDTLTASSDTLEDVLLGLPGHTSDEDFSKGKRMVGSLWLMHGTNQIPVRLNPKWMDVASIPQQNSTGISFFPNPITRNWSLATILWPAAEQAEYRLFNLLGNEVGRGSLRLLGGAEQQRIYFPSLASGVYVFVLHSGRAEARSKLVIAH